MALRPSAGFSNGHGRSIARMICLPHSPSAKPNRWRWSTASYQQVYTPGILNQTFVTSGKITAPDLADQLSGPGAFVDLDGDGNQWAPSARALFSPDPASPDSAFAARHFYLPQGAVDPWGNVSSVAYDAHDLLVTQTTDTREMSRRHSTTTGCSHRGWSPTLISTVPASDTTPSDWWSRRRRWESFSQETSTRVITSTRRPPKLRPMTIPPPS